MAECNPVSRFLNKEDHLRWCFMLTMAAFLAQQVYAGYDLRDQGSAGASSSNILRFSKELTRELTQH